MRRRSISIPLSLTALLLTTLMPPALAMQEEDDRHEQEVAPSGTDASRDDGEAAQRHVSRHRFVFVDGDGAVEEATGDGDQLAWITVAGPHGNLRLHTPKHGALPILAGGGFLGVGTVPMTPELRRHFGAPEDAGVLISEIVDDSPAFRAGLKVGDVLSAVDGESIHDGMDLLHRIRSHEEGDAVSLDLVRDGSVEQVVAVLGETPATAEGGFSWLYRFDCGDEEADCDGQLLELCGDAGRCRVRVECDGGTCRCEAGGEAVECDRLESLDLPPHD